MKPYSIITSEADLPDAPSASPLFRFLEVFDPGCTQMIAARDLLTGGSIDTKVAFLCLPNRLGAQHLRRLRAKRFVLIDYFDSPQITWGTSDREFMLSNTDLYLKTSYQPGVDHGVRLGLLPLPLSPRTMHALRIRTPLMKWRKHWIRWTRQAERSWDVALQGLATFRDEPRADGGRDRYHQRIEWMREMRSQADWKHWGGLYLPPYLSIEAVEAEYGPVGDLFGQAKRMRLQQFLGMMAQTKVALCPMGHAPWSYRHIEAIYCDCEIVSNDLSRFRTLPALPIDLIDQVPDHAPIAPTVNRALAEWQHRRDRRASARQRMEAFLCDGGYSRRRAAIYDEFRQQLATA